MTKEDPQDPVTFEPTYFVDPLECHSCEKKYCHVIKNDCNERFCKNCFAHRYGVEETMKIEEAMDEVANQLWEIPLDKLSKELKSKLSYIVKPSNQGND